MHAGSVPSNSDYAKAYKVSFIDPADLGVIGNFPLRLPVLNERNMPTECVNFPLIIENTTTGKRVMCSTTLSLSEVASLNTGVTPDASPL